MRRNRTNNADPKRRKISLQNDYAFGIISPVTSATLPIPVPVLRHGVSDESTIPCVIPRPWQVETRRFSENFTGTKDPNLDLAVDPLSESLGFHSATTSSNYSTSSERFRRWSLSNLQSAFKATDPSGTEFSSQFTSDDEEFYRLSRENLHGSYSSLLVGGGPGGSWISGFIPMIPDRFPRISFERRPISSSQNNIYYPDEDLKRQLQNFYVY